MPVLGGGGGGGRRLREFTIKFEQQPEYYKECDLIRKVGVANWSRFGGSNYFIGCYR